MVSPAARPTSQWHTRHLSLCPVGGCFGVEMSRILLFSCTLLPPGDRTEAPRFAGLGTVTSSLRLLLNTGRRPVPQRAKRGLQRVKRQKEGGEACPRPAPPWGGGRFSRCPGGR